MNEQANTALLPCPFCGDQPTVQTRPVMGTEFRTYRVRCISIDCLAIVATVDMSTVLGASQIWNRRK